MLIDMDKKQATKLRRSMLFNFHTYLQKRLAVQPSLFPDEQDEREARLDQVVDQIRNHFGTTSLRRASTVQHNADHKPLPPPEWATMSQDQLAELLTADPQKRHPFDRKP
jgi:hypothetical protein